MNAGDGQMIALWVKAAYTAMAALVVSVYCVAYKPANFLWFSDIALIGLVPALWLENSLLASMMALAVLLPEILWNIGFFSRLIFGVSLFGLSDYMFDGTRPLYVRALSLFHVVLPVALVWTVSRLGYDRRALGAQTGLGWAVLIVTYLVTEPADNINWVFGPGGQPQHRLPGAVYFLLVMIVFPLAVYVPTHLVLAALFGRRAT